MAKLSIFIILSTSFVLQGASCDDSEGNLDTECRKVPFLVTKDSGAPADSKESSLQAGPRGPIALVDTVLIETLANMNRERIPERIGHPKGSGAFGYFEVTDLSFTQFCKATLFQKLGHCTDIFIRFSTPTLELGSCDSVRGFRGTAIKFYTDVGNFDMVGNNIPIFAIRDPHLMLSFLHSQRRDPVSNLMNATTVWDFASLRPELLHQLIMVFSNRGTPDGFRYMNMFSSHTFKVVNKDGKAFYTKFHVKSDQGIRTLNASAAITRCGMDPDYSTRDLFTAIAKGSYPSWTWYYQIMTIEEADKFRWNPFDLTKVWPHREFPLHKIGRVVLDRNPKDFYADVEQAAFSPSNLVPGIEPSPDPVLQDRMFAYPDAQRYRIGGNFNQLPINQPRVTVINDHRNGMMAFRNQEGLPNYYPNAVGSQLQVCPWSADSVYSVEGYVKRYNTSDDDNISQPRTFYEKVLDVQEREALCVNLADNIGLANPDVQKRAVALWSLVSEDLKQCLIKQLEAIGEP